MDDRNPGLSHETQARIDRLFELLRDETNMTDVQRQFLQARIADVLNYHAKVGIMGKTGAGKSTLCNALFGREIAAVNAVKACTREPQDIAFVLEAGKGITLIDMPGVGEDEERDIEYRTLYENLLPELDLVLWVIKADDRALAADMDFHDRVVHPFCRKAGVPILFVINQIDKIDPIQEWDHTIRQPGPEQTRNIGLKISIVSRLFNLHSQQICTVSAIGNHGLIELVEKIVRSLPHEKKWGFTREAAPEHVSARTRIESEKGLWETIKQAVVTVCREGAQRVLSSLSSAACTLFGWLG